MVHLTTTQLHTYADARPAGAANAGGLLLPTLRLRVCRQTQTPRQMPTVQKDVAQVRQADYRSEEKEVALSTPPQITIGYINYSVFKTPYNMHFTSVKAFSCFGGLARTRQHKNLKSAKTPASPIEY
jgi:hypothetical protein